MLTILGILVIALGTWLVHQGVSLKNKERHDKLITQIDLQTKTINSLQESNAVLNKGISTLTQMSSQQNDQLTTLGQENIELNKELKLAQSEVLKSVLGGDGHPRVSILSDLTSGNMQFYVQNLGWLPIYDVLIAISNYNSNGESIYFDRKTIGNIAPKNSSLIGEGFIPPSDGKIHITFTIITRNGVYYQTLVTRKSNKDPRLLAEAFTLKKYDMSIPGYKLIDEGFSPDFPESEKKKIDWELANKVKGTVGKRRID